MNGNTNSKCDAALLCGMQSGFVGYQSSNGLITLLIELEANVDDNLAAFKKICVEHKATYLVAHFNAKSCFQTGTGSREWLDALIQSPKVVRLVLANELAPLRPMPIGLPIVQDVQTKSLTKSTGKVLVGLIDHGCAFAHDEFLDAGVTRVLSLWDQDDSSQIQDAHCFLNNHFNRGIHIDRTGLESIRASVGADDMKAYAMLGYSCMRHKMLHGPHSMGLLAGKHLSPSLTVGLAQSLRNKPLSIKNDEPSEDIVFVQLPRPVLLAPSSGAMGRNIVDGVRYIMSHAGEKTRKVVVCVPYGSITGPHDGSGWVEQALDEIVAQAYKDKKIDLKIVFASGNSAQKKVYAKITSQGAKAADSKQSLGWCVPPDIHSNTGIEFWVKDATHMSDITLHAPDDCTYKVKWSAKSPVCLKVQGIAVGYLLVQHFPKTSQYCVSIQLIPQLPGATAHLCAGRWCVDLDMQNNSAMSVDVYAGWGGKNQGFDKRIFPTRLIALSEGVHIPGEGAILGTACGAQTYVIGACRKLPSFVRAQYSAAGASRSANKSGVDCLGIGEESSYLPGVVCIGTRSGFHGRTNGTSAAAPQAARILVKCSFLAFASEAESDPYPRMAINAAALKPELVLDFTCL